MLTMHPSIMLGSYVLDEDRLPRDEFEIRLAPLYEMMKTEGYAATLVYGDAREHEALAYFTNFIPRMRWAMAMIPAQGEPRLLISISSRDMPAMKTMTGIADVKSGWEWKWFDEFIARFASPAKLATINFDMMTPLLFGQLAKSIAERFDLVDVDGIAAQARAIHRPREIAMTRIASGIVREMGAEIRAKWTDGADVETAALAGERLARARGAQDVRTLVSRDNGLTLEPYRAQFTGRPKTLLTYAAVKYMGYWAETFVSTGGAVSAANARLETMLAAVKPGAPVCALAQHADHPTLAGSGGHRIGLSPIEGAEFTQHEKSVIETNIVYALRAGCIVNGVGAIASAMVCLRGNGMLETLVRSEMSHN